MNTPADPMFSQLLDWSLDFAAKHDPVAIDGADYELPGQTAYTKSTHKLPTGGRVEVNLTTPIAQLNFSWLAEITIDDIKRHIYRHILLQTDNTIVETMGKTVTSISNAEAVTILKRLQQLVG